MQNVAYVLDTNYMPVTPCSLGAADDLIKQGNATLESNEPYTIRLKYGFQHYADYSYRAGFLELIILVSNDAIKVTATLSNDRIVYSKEIKRDSVAEQKDITDRRLSTWGFDDNTDRLITAEITTVRDFLPVDIIVVKGI